MSPCPTMPSRFRPPTPVPEHRFARIPRASAAHDPHLRPRMPREDLNPSVTHPGPPRAAPERRTSRPVTRIVALTAILGLVAGAPRAEDCATLQLLSLNEGVVAMLGSRESGPRVPELRLAGCGSATPRLRLRWARGRDGDWSQAGELPPGLSGVVFQHGLRPWTAGLPERAPGRFPAIALAPLGPASRLAVSEAPREAEALAVAVAALDEWHLGIVQQLPGARLLVEVVTSHGPAELLERVSSLVVRADWPEGSRLLGVAGEADRLAVFARAPDGALLTILARPDSWRAGVPMALPAATAATGLWLEGEAAVFTAGADGIASWSLAGVAWLERGSAPAPGDRLWAAATFGERRSRIAAVAWDGDELRAWSWQGGVWSEDAVPDGRVGSVLQASASSPVAAAAPRGRQSGLGTGAKRLLMGLGLAGALLGALLCARLLKRR